MSYQLGLVCYDDDWHDDGVYNNIDDSFYYDNKIDVEFIENIEELSQMIMSFTSHWFEK